MTIFAGILLGMALVVLINKLSINAYDRGWRDALEVTLSLAKGQYVTRLHIEEFLEKRLNEKSL